MLLKIVTLDELETHCALNCAVDGRTLAAAQAIVDRVRIGGQSALEECVREFDGKQFGERLMFGPDDFAAACSRIPDAHVQLLERTAERIRLFAEKQLSALKPVDMNLGGFQMGQSWHPLGSAGCYVPGGRYPLVSSLLMTTTTARTAGVRLVVAACPATSDLMLAAAGVCRVDGFVAAGGAHAIAAMAYGAGHVPAVDVVVGPGNRWVTAAKQLVSGQVKIDMLAGPSELVVLADESADPAIVAADLLAQAEHDCDARPILVTSSSRLLANVERELAIQLSVLPTAETALAALGSGFAVLVDDIPTGIDVCEIIAPEHLELQIADAGQAARKFSRCGCVFIGSLTSEVFGDYGAGPNHVLPTGGTARFASGLSVATFLRTQTWLKVEDGESINSLARDSIQLANLEGLFAHARSAEMRIKSD